MKNFKRSRNLSLLAGFGFIISTIIALESNQFILVPILYVIASILFFAGAYTNHKKLINNGVNVGEVMEVGDSLTLNFSDIEGNYFAVQEIRRG